MNDVPTAVCPGCTIKNDEGFSRINCMSCSHLAQVIITKTIRDQRSINENERIKV